MVACLALLTLLLAACAAPTPSPTPTPLSPPLALTTPALAPWVTERVRAFGEAHGPPGFDLGVSPPEAAREAVEKRAAALLVAAVPPPENWFATPLGLEPVAVIVHPDNPVRSLSLDEVHDLFAGRVDTWADLGGRDLRPQPVVPLADDEVRRLLESDVLQGTRVPPFALLAPSPAAAVELVAEDPAAVALAPLTALTGEVRAVRLGGVLPSLSTAAEGRYPLVLDVVATAPAEPPAPLRDWLLWLQAAQE